MSSAATLLADVGGTYTRFWTSENARLASPKPVVAETTAFPGFVEALHSVLPRQPHFARVIIAAAGPRTTAGIRLTNGGWNLAEEPIRRATGAESVVLINDFEAQAHAIPNLGPNDVMPVCGPSVEGPVDGSFVVLGPGTGLGCAEGQWNRKREAPWVRCTEAGHIPLAARTESEWRMLQRVLPHHEYAAAESVLSGAGLIALHEALAAEQAQTHGVPAGAKAIVDAAGAGQPLARATLDRFADLLATFAVTMALTLRPTTGLWLTGGVITRMATLFPAERFSQRFVAHGRQRDYLAALPVSLVTHPNPALPGLLSINTRGISDHET